MVSGILLLGSFAWAGSASASECTRLVASGNPEYPPYLWRDPANPEQLVGANAELMKRLASEIGVPIEVRYIGSWARVQEEMKSGRIDLIAGAFLTTPRLEYMDYFLATIATTRSVVITATGSKMTYGQWSDLAGYDGLTVIDNSFGEEFDRYAAENLKIAEVGKLENALQMLAGKRADYLIYEDAPARAFAARANIVGLVEAEVPISNENLYLTMSHLSPCNTPTLRGKIAKAMQKFATEKVMDSLIGDSIEAWRTQ
jgi:polar amino acid transport system substrate-binding protein